jgi:hypothetical protein
VRYRVRFNKSRGQPGRGTPEHVWRVFDETGKEWLCKHVEFHLPSRSEQEANSEDWNMVCEGKMLIDRNTSTIKIVDDTI